MLSSRLVSPTASDRKGRPTTRTQTAEVYVPKSLSCDFRPEIDLRVFFATGTAHFDGLVVEEL